jgi:hypothetical protein
MSKLDDIVARVEASMCMTYSAGWTEGHLEARIGKDDWDAVRSMLSAVPEPLYKTIERILDDHSAWIARPNREVTEKVALAALIAAHVALTPEGPLQ